MNTNDVIFLGLKSCVAAVSKRDGSILWSTQLPGGMGGGFVTVNSDGKSVFAYTNGKIHCLDISSGRILRTNASQVLATASLPFASQAFQQLQMLLFTPDLRLIGNQAVRRLRDEGLHHGKTNVKAEIM